MEPIFDIDNNIFPLNIINKDIHLQEDKTYQIII
jgi:hypothetical protein